MKSHSFSVNGASGGAADDQVEAYLDRTLADADHAAFEAALDQEPRLQEAVRLAREVRAGLRRWPAPSCPPDVTAAIRAAIDREEGGSRFAADRPARRRSPERLWSRLLQPALAAALLVGIVTSAALVGRPQPQPPTADVQAALRDVQWTLGYLAEVGRGTGATLRTDILEEHVVVPVQDALDSVFNEATP